LHVIDVARDKLKVNVSDRLREALERLDQAIDRLDASATVGTGRGHRRKARPDDPAYRNRIG
jgi:hypothetical protein